ncbi:MAG: glycosyltransferase family 4 protein [Candidatus Heimdallarchaeota archaeon]
MEEFEIIVFFVERFSKDDIGGVKSYLRRIIHNFTEKGIKTKIVTLKTKIHPLEEENVNGIDVVRLDCGDFLDRVDEFSKVAPEKREEVAKEYFKDNDIENTSFKLAEKLLEFIKKERPMSIHYQNSFFLAPYAVYFLRQNFGVKESPAFYFWCHSPSSNLVLPDGQASSLYSSLSSFQNLFKQVFAVSKSVHSELLQAGINSKVRYLGINIETFSKKAYKREETRKKLGISEGTFLILYTGRIIKEKGLNLLPDIYKDLVKRDDSFRTIQFLLVGEGDYKEELIQQLQTEGIDNRFHFTSVTKDEELANIYSSADCFILPSQREALGLSLIEAMSCSLTCVVNDLPGIREIVEHKRNGLFVPKNDISEFVRWIASLFKNKLLREELALAARQTIEEKFNENKHYRYFTLKYMD